MRVRFRCLVSCSFAVAWSGPALGQYAPPAPPPAGTAPAPSGSPSSLSAGGLAPPPAIETAPAQPGAPTPASTEAQLNRADREDSGRGLEFVWLNAEAGVTHVGLGTFHQKNFLDQLDVKTNETGLLVGAGAGVRLVFLTLGARFRYAPMPDYKLWSLGVEGGIHAPFGAFEPYGTVDLGYASLGSFSHLDSSGSVHGFDARLAAGLDYYFTPMFSLGLNVSGDLLLLARSASAIDCIQHPLLHSRDPNSSAPSRVVDYCSSGNGTGGAVSGTFVAGLHF